MTFPTVTEVPPVLAPVTPNTFVFAIVRGTAAPAGLDERPEPVDRPRRP